MIENATLIQYAEPGHPDKSGNVGYPAPYNIHARCTLDEPSRAQTIAMANKLKDIVAVLYVLKSALTQWPQVKMKEQSLANVHLDGGGGDVYEILKTFERQHGDQSHYECFLKVTSS
jgi:hypothetical protein